MSNLSPSMLVLDKGLNLQTAKIMAPKGTMLDSLNYEQVDFQGQKRIDGYARYDGSALSAFDDFAILPADADYEVGGDDRGLMYNALGELFGIQLALLNSGGIDYVTLAVLDETAIPDGWEWGADFFKSPELHYEMVLEYQAYVRSFVESLPGGIIGLHWFRDRLYAVADLMVLRIEDGEGPADILPNDVLILESGEFLALDTRYSDGSLYVLTDIMFSATTIQVERTGMTYPVAERHAGIMATFWEARTEQQVLDERQPTDPYDFGWKFKHLGWRVPFIEGNSVYGSLTSLNQNRQGVGVQGPTGISGENGRPLFLVQKVPTTNLPTQVNGWKTSTSRTVYNLEADALDQIDGYSIYADAFFSWTAESPTPSAPGITGEGMIEYPANNTVPVDV